MVKFVPNIDIRATLFRAKTKKIEQKLLISYFYSSLVKLLTFLLSYESRNELIKLFLILKEDENLIFHILISGNIRSQHKLVSNQLNTSEERL